MSTVDHLLAECGRLRAAWGWLTETVIPGRTRRNQRTYSQHATAKRNALALAERHDRAKLLATGKLLAGNSSAPANLAAIDAREQIAHQADHTAWTLASHLRNRVQVPYRPGQPAYQPNGTNADTRFRAAIDWISLNAARLGPDDQEIINTTYRELIHSTDLATAVAGCGPDLRPLAAECPACGRRTLRWDCSSPEPAEWHVRCTNRTCHCDGRDCTCKVPERQPGMAHVWLESMWSRLAEQINTKDTP